MNMTTRTKQSTEARFGLEFDRTSLPSINMDTLGPVARSLIPLESRNMNTLELSPGESIEFGLIPKGAPSEETMIRLINEIRSLRKDLKSLEQVTRISGGGTH